ncbi:tetratricopeptide repeat protein [Paraburkholderia sp. Tr-20389]|uniref:O-linked N-acetylglucosamine transferase, SPINDLY family protein n=1 Tax=Paraburkholderia sp. Tr-20389 TaxID=2703903 RepID=UPI00197DF83D|nr:tetratricopeptide repeat protein [Paraburkholderia sp. Tr-20389]MBN3752028.1 tetratricopeptide repeat protein [Paraburkholderia sp. Tr-20389]
MNDTEAQLDSALVHHRAGRLAQAKALYEQILRTQPGQPDALHRLGLLACQTGQHEAGIALMERSLAARPDAVCCNDLGIVLSERGQVAQAIERYRRAIALRPDYPEAHNNLGNALKDTGELEAAAASYRKAIGLRPDFPQAYVNLSAVQRRQKAYLLAIGTAQRAVQLAPGLAEAHNNLGNAYHGLDDLAAAAASYRRALELDPVDSNTHHNLSLVLLKQGRYGEAQLHCRRAMAACTSNASMHVCLGDILRAQGDMDGAIDAYRAAHQLDPGGATLALPRLLFCAAGSARVTPQQFLDDARRYGRLMASRARPFVHDRQKRAARAAGRPLRVGFVSPDLRQHPVGIFLESVLAHIDRTRIEPIAYATHPAEDDVTARLKAHFSAWHSLVGLDTESAARRILGDGIDVLIDLAGHTAWSALPVFCWKPAPVQSTWIGFFATTGCEAIDYIIGDRYVLPASEEHHFVEKPWRLPDCYVCFTPPPYDVEVASLPMLSAGTVTFGYFGKLTKVTDDVIALWSQLLCSVERSRLFLKAPALDARDLQQAMAHRFAIHGIAPERLTLEGASPRDQYFAAYNRVDIALSPFPYSAGTTTAEALWMGVPVLCLAGDRFVAHICESMLHTAGLGDWIAASRQAYVEKAVAFTNDRARLAHLRKTLRARVLASSLGDAPRFARTLEAAFRAMWDRYLAADDSAQM